MAVVTLTFIKSDKEISSGIPESVAIESNIPSTIYYTLDGSTPTLDSPIYISTLDIPTGQNSVTLSAFGVDSEDNVGPILTQVFAPDTTRITVTRFVGQEGIIQNRADYGDDIVTGYDADGAPGRFLDADPSNYEFINSETDRYLNDVGEVVEINVPDSSTNPTFDDDNFQPFSTPEFAEFFNPQAKMILIDNRKENDINIMPRPYGSFYNVYKEYGGKRIREPEASYISGGFVRRFYDAKRKVMVGYYFDHNEARYIKNIQTLPENIPGVGGGVFSLPLVFKWLGRDGRQSSI